MEGVIAGDLNDIKNKTTNGVSGNSEVRPKKAARRSLTAKFKLRILEQADACTAFGDLAKLLRREGVYSNQLRDWRKARESGALTNLAPKKRGVRATPVNPLAKHIAALEKEMDRVCERLKQAEAIIEIQKKIAEILCPAIQHVSSEGKSCN